MTSNSGQPSNTPKIDASLAEIHSLIATLEAQLKSGIRPTCLDITADESSMPKVFAPDREESAFLVDC